jgi:hypothetical protein
MAGTPLHSFELYTTPPRVVLPLETTLQDLKLVPAAVLYLSWTAPPSVSDPEPAFPGESYLQQALARRVRSLLSRAEEGEGGGEERSGSGVNYFPRGSKLGGKGEVPPKQESGDGESGGKGGESESKERKPSMKKPKWLKT